MFLGFRVLVFPLKSLYDMGEFSKIRCTLLGISIFMNKVLGVYVGVRPLMEVTTYVILQTIRGGTYEGYRGLI